ncbi:MAG: transglutaminase-like domain-containing protein [Thermoproteota archaeon]
MNYKLFVFGIIIVALGYTLTFIPVFFNPSEGATSQNVSYALKTNYTYVLSESFLLQNELKRRVNDIVYVSVPMNTTNQWSFLLNTSSKFSYIFFDIDKSPILVYNITLNPSEKIWINLTFKVIVERYKLTFGNDVPWYTQEQTLNLTGEKTYWPVGNETYVKIANKLSANTKTPIEVAKNIANWIIDHLNYVIIPRIGGERAILYVNGKYMVYGDCEEVADVFVTLSRTLGIPSRVAHGLLLREHNEKMYINFTDQGPVLSNNWGGHAWPQMYVRNFGWIDVEMLEGLVAKVGDLSENHIKFNIEEKKYYGSTIDSFCISSYLSLKYMEFSTRLIGG